MQMYKLNIYLKEENQFPIYRARRWAFWTDTSRLIKGLSYTKYLTHVKYCSHLWAGAPKYQLDSFDFLQKRAIRSQSQVSQLESLDQCRDYRSLFVFYRLFHGKCYEELFGLVPLLSFYLLHSDYLEAFSSITVRFQRFLSYELVRSEMNCQLRHLQNQSQRNANATLPLWTVLLHIFYKWYFLYNCEHLGSVSQCLI